ELAWELGKNTFFLATVASIIAASLAVVIAYGKRQFPSPLMRLSSAIAGLGYAIPGGVVAVGVLIPTVWLDHRLGDLLDSLFGTTTGLLLSGTVVAVILGYQVRFMAVSLSIVESGLTRIRPSLDDAARLLGASRT